MAAMILSSKAIQALSSLTAEEKRWIQARLAGNNITRSYEVAGVKRNSGDPIHLRPHVQLALSAAARHAAEQLSLTKQDVLQGMLDAVYAAESSADLVNAWREIGKLVNAYDPERKDIYLTVRTPDDLRGLPDEELARLVEANVDEPGAAQLADEPTDVEPTDVEPVADRLD